MEKTLLSMNATRHPDEAKEKLQILCANCNWIKRYGRKEFGGEGGRPRRVP